MISKETYDKIQEYKETGLSILKATQKLGISYNTTYKWWNKTDEEFTSFQKEHEFVLDNYRQYIIEQLKLCPQINNTLILRRLQENFPDFEIFTVGINILTEQGYLLISGIYHRFGFIENFLRIP